MSGTLSSIDPNTSHLGNDLEAETRALKARIDGTIEVSGPELAGSLGEMGLVDEYRLYINPVVRGGGTPFFSRAHPTLRLVFAANAAAKT